MAWSYKPLWILLIQKNMKKTDLLKVAGLNSSALAKMGKDQPVTMGTLGRLCEVLDCSLSDIVEYVPEAQIEK